MHASSLARFRGVIVAAVVVLAMFVPMVVIQIYGAAILEELGEAKPAAGEVTVGIAVILRATARRLLRQGAQNLMRTTAGALGRTSVRTFTRRFVKFTGRLFFSSVVQESAEVEGGSVESKEASSTRASQLVALGLGFVGLCLSFRGVLYVAGEEITADVLGGTGLTMLEAVVLAGVPLLAYAGLHQVFGRLFNVTARYRTEIDGLLLQGYFTGAGSFLPLTTDVDYFGTAQAKRRMAIASILGMFVVHAALLQIGTSVESPELQFLGAMFLVYAFVYTFPIKPLEGHFIWSTSKWQWALVTLPILAAFVTSLPLVFSDIL